VGIAVLAAILISTLAFLPRIINRGRTSDLTREEFRLLKAFNEQAKRNPRAYLSVEFAAYKAEVDENDVKLQRLKDLGYLKDSNVYDKVGVRRRQALIKRHYLNTIFP
jgi:hypothetical protein